MRATPLIFSAFLVLIAFALGIPHRHTHERRAEAAVVDGQAEGEILTGNAAEEAEAADAIEIQQEQQRIRVAAGPLPPDLWTDPARRTLLEKRTEQVKGAFLHSWNNYNRISLGQSGDEVKPRSGTVENTR